MDHSNGIDRIIHSQICKAKTHRRPHIGEDSPRLSMPPTGAQSESTRALIPRERRPRTSRQWQASARNLRTSPTTRQTAAMACEHTRDTVGEQCAAPLICTELAHIMCTAHRSSAGGPPNRRAAPVGSSAPADHHETCLAATTLAVGNLDILVKFTENRSVPWKDRVR